MDQSNTLIFNGLIYKLEEHNSHWFLSDKIEGMKGFASMSNESEYEHMSNKYEYMCIEINKRYYKYSLVQPAQQAQVIDITPVV